MKQFLFQTLFFILLSESAGVVLNRLILHESATEVAIESLIAGMTSSIIYYRFAKSFKRRQEKLEKETIDR
ncbi:hypothetical protein GCM10027037_33310 [Mucilaginibacter koreensis]